MPRPRFLRLPHERRTRLLEVAAQEFAAYGFEGASLNQILEQTSVSKGAAYYYFDDKADLFATVVRHYFEQTRGDVDLAMIEVTAESFWPLVSALYRQQFMQAIEHPWLLRLLKSAATLPPDVPAAGALADITGEVHAWLTMLLEKGREVGLVRQDLPPELLLALILAVDDATDRWLLSRRERFDQTEIEGLVALMVDTWKRLLVPARGST